jgi:tetratricopeptide (TPR) repeat protein
MGLSGGGLPSGAPRVAWVYCVRMATNSMRLPGLVLVLASTGCSLFGSYPTTWEGRYRKASQELRAAKDDLARFYALADAAKSAFEIGKMEEAQAHAQKALDLAAGFRDNWNYGNAIHDGHMVLGRVALRKGDLESAKRELLEAGRTPGSPQLDSFGPNMSLAKDLIERKETDTVVSYFELCGKFWELERGNLKRWSALAKAGEMPDFGANLVY